MNNNLTLNQLMQEYSATVAEYLSKGYYFEFGECSSYTHVDSYAALINHKENSRIRVWLIDEEEYEDHIYSCYKKLIVRSYDMDESTCWPKQGKVISCKIFYGIGSNKYFTTDLDTYTTWRIKQQNRSGYAYFRFNHNASRALDLAKIPTHTMAHLMDRIHNIPGMKRSKSDCITNVIARRSSYRIEYIVEYKDNKAQTKWIWLK